MLHIYAQYIETHMNVHIKTTHRCTYHRNVHTHYTSVHMPQKHTHLFREALLMSWDPRVLALDLSMTK